MVRQCCKRYILQKATMFHHLRTVALAFFTVAIVIAVLSSCGPRAPTREADSSSLSAPEADSSPLCERPPADASQPQSTYLPLAIGNEWVYTRTVSQGVFSWEAYRESGKDEITLAAAPSPDIPVGESEETYLITNMVEEDGYQHWEVKVSDSKARDGRYGSLLTKPDKVLWGRVDSSEHLIEIDELLIKLKGHFSNEKRHSRILVIEPLQEGVEARLSGVGLEAVLYTVPPQLVDVEVPAGKFPCSLEMNMLVEADQRSWETRSYYASHVGLVKELQRDEMGNLTYTMELAKYELK